MVKSTPQAKSLEVCRLPLVGPCGLDGLWDRRGPQWVHVSAKTSEVWTSGGSFRVPSLHVCPFGVLINNLNTSSQYRSSIWAPSSLCLTWVQDSCRAAPRSTISGVVWSLVSLRRPCLYFIVRKWFEMKYQHNEISDKWMESRTAWWVQKNDFTLL